MLETISSRGIESHCSNANYNANHNSIKKQPFRVPLNLFGAVFLSNDFRRYVWDLKRFVNDHNMDAAQSQNENENPCDDVVNNDPSILQNIDPNHRWGLPESEADLTVEMIGGRDFRHTSTAS